MEELSGQPFLSRCWEEEGMAVKQNPFRCQRELLGSLYENLAL